MTDLLSNERLEAIRVAYRDGDTNFYLRDTEITEIVTELLQRREAAEKPVAFDIQDADARARGERGFLRRYAGINEDDIRDYEITVTPLFEQPPLTSAERERLADLERAHENWVDLNLRNAELCGKLKEATDRLAAYDRAAKEPAYTRYDCGCCGYETLSDSKYIRCPKCNHNKMSATPLFTAPPLPVVPKTLLRELVDVVWQEAKESTEVPSTKWADELIGKVFPSAQVLPVVLDERQSTLLFDEWFKAIEAGDDENRKEPKYLSKEWNEYLARMQLARGAWNAAMLKYGDFRENQNPSTKNFRENAETSTKYPEKLPCDVMLQPGMTIRKGCHTTTLLFALNRRSVYEAELSAMSAEDKADMQKAIEEFKRQLAPVQIYAVIPEGCCVMPKKLTADNGAKGALSGEFSETKTISCPECLGDDECETCDGSGTIKINVPVSWTTIKAIWAKGVEHFAATPQPNKDNS